VYLTVRASSKHKKWPLC